MGHTQIIIFSSILAYFALMIIFGIVASRNQTHEGFVIGSRNVGYIPTIGSLASSFRDGMGVIFWFGFAVTAGYGGLSLFIGVIAGLAIYSFIGPRIRAIAAEHDYITIGEIIRARLGIMTERFSSLIVLIVAFMIIAVQLHVSGHIFSEVLDKPPAFGVWSVAIVVGFYLFFGGYSTVIKTDAVQFFLIISLLIVPFFFRPSMEDVMAFDTLFILGPREVIALGLFGFFFVLSAADVWQRVFSARNDKVIRISFPVAGVFLLIMTFSLIYLGMASKPYLGSDIDSNTAFYMIFNGGFIPPFLLAYIAVVVMAICMSTLDTACYLSAATLARNFFPHKVTDERNTYIRFSQIVMIFILVTASILALTISDIIVFVFSAGSLLFVLSPIYLYVATGWPKHRSRRSDVLVTMSIAVSSIIYIYMFIEGYFNDTLMTIFPVSISIILTSLAIFIGSKKPKQS